jgi:hypothetical protein
MGEGRPEDAFREVQRAARAPLAFPERTVSAPEQATNFWVTGRRARYERFARSLRDALGRLRAPRRKLRETARTSSEVSDPIAGIVRYTQIIPRERAPAGCAEGAAALRGAGAEDAWDDPVRAAHV